LVNMTNNVLNLHYNKAIKFILNGVTDNTAEILKESFDDEYMSDFRHALMGRLAGNHFDMVNGQSGLNVTLLEGACTMTNAAGVVVGKSEGTGGNNGNGGGESTGGTDPSEDTDSSEGTTTTASKKKSSDAMRSTSVSVFATLLALSAALVSSRQ